MGKLGFESKRHALAYLMGVYLSDGHLSLNSDSFMLAVSDEEFRDQAALALEQAGSRCTRRRSQPAYLNSKPCYRVRERSPYRVGSWLGGLFLMEKDYLPEIQSDLARDLVAGVLDGDGCITRLSGGRSDYQLSVSGCRGYLKDLQALFASHDVLMHYYPDKMAHYINLRSFIRARFYFRLRRKNLKVVAHAAYIHLPYPQENQWSS